jgi:hypothetical protein
VKKAELKQGVAYYVSTSGNYGWGYRDSFYEIHKQNERARFYVIFENGEPMSYYRNASQVYMTTCKTWGYGCPDHTTEDGGFRCYRTEYRLMDIREEYWTVIKRLHARRKEERSRSKDIRGARLIRIAKRNKEAQEAPIKAEFYSVLNQMVGGYCSPYDRLNEFNLEQMQKITNALKASMPSVQAVA